MDIQIFDNKKKLTKEQLKTLCETWFGEMVKAVADIELGVVAVGGEWHADGESLLLESGSKQENLWGFNIYQNRAPEESVEFVSLINIRPRQNNKTMEIQDIELRKKISNLVSQITQL